MLNKCEKQLDTNYSKSKNTSNIKGVNEATAAIVTFPGM